MNKIYKVAVIGGGASGLMCAVDLCSGKNALLGKDVLILERNDRVGKKLIATGNGQGNLMNERFGAENYRGEKAFVDDFIRIAKEIDLESYLDGLGIPLCTLKDGKKYPLSRQASSVLDTLRAYLSFKGCITETNAFVKSVKSRKEYFVLTTENGEYFAEKVVMATGGTCAKQFGTDGYSYILAEKFGHKKTALYPALVQLKTEMDAIKGLKGLKEVASVTAYKNGKPIKNSVGDILFTDFGVSGNTVFQVSSAFDGVGDEFLSIEFLPELSLEQLIEIINKRLSLKHIDKSEVLSGVLNKRVGQAVLKVAKTSSAVDIANAVKNFKLKVTGNLGFNFAQVTKGGIATKDVNALTMESKLVKDFYIVGETLDVDGDCGGYNVTFAFVSGIIASRAIKTNI